FTSTPITIMTNSSSGFPIGYALVTVFTNGIAEAKYRCNNGCYPWEAVSGIRVAAVIVAYFSFVIGLGIFLVCGYSIPAWHFRYIKLVTVDPDYEVAKREWRSAFWMWLGAVLIAVPIALLILFNPYAHYALSLGRLVYRFGQTATNDNLVTHRPFIYRDV